jgi:hypothetical protein
MVSEGTLTLSYFVENTLEYYRNVLLLIIYILYIYIYIYIYISYLIYGPWSMQIIYQPTFDTYINIFPQSASYILKSSSSFPSPFATNIPYPFLISLKPPFPTQFSRHIRSMCSICLTFQLCFKIAFLICFACRVRN